ncbi:type II secretion system protein GspG [Gammaproteobacteria bacterium 45_16_T64]|nr:type II secretion system protein GspG [Gammaproteobacteria bacterium 45_16_T64]
MNKQRFRRMPTQKAAGFTLIEIMVVVVILGVLAGLVAVNVFGNVDKANAQAARVDISAISQALDLYKLDNFTYPTTDLGLDALTNKPDSARGWPSGGYLKKNPVDPWERPYGYISPGTNGEPYELYSLGADGNEGGEGPAKDITLADL